MIFSLRHLDGFPLFFMTKTNWAYKPCVLAPVYIASCALYHVPPPCPSLPVHQTLALVQFVDATGLLHKLIPPSGTASHLPLPIVNSCSLIRSQLLREASPVPLLLSSLVTMYLSFITPITVSILYPFVWFFDWGPSPPLDSELHNGEIMSQFWSIVALQTLTTALGKKLMLDI